jgi:hypothetical protein
MIGFFFAARAISMSDFTSAMTISPGAETVGGFLPRFIRRA